MSPEQAEMNALGVDTRSDIYSLGVLLYELLTGTTPLEKKRLREAALDEMVRLIRQEEAPRPSARLSSSNNLPKIAAARNTDPARLSKLVRGDIDWIVMKCLEKDRTRRYESAGGLARDIEEGERGIDAEYRIENGPHVLRRVGPADMPLAAGAGGPDHLARVQSRAREKHNVRRPVMVASGGVTFPLGRSEAQPLLIPEAVVRPAALAPERQVGAESGGLRRAAPVRPDSFRRPVRGAPS
jgi:serine/threonine protein kinase